MKVYGYELCVVCADVWEGSYGDIYDNLDECIKDHPNSSIIYGFSLVGNDDETPDWFDTVEEAFDWAKNHPINKLSKEMKI